MEVFGIMAFIFAISNIGLGDKVKKLERDLRKIKNSNNSLTRGEMKMSEIIKELKGKRCKLTVSGGFSGPIECQVLSIDDEWMKVSQIGKKNEGKIKIIRVSDINAIDDITD